MSQSFIIVIDPQWLKTFTITYSGHKDDNWDADTDP